jgi:hypothetical protein
MDATRREGAARGGRRRRVAGRRGRRGRLGEGATSGTRKHTYVWVNVYLRPHQALFLPLSFFANELSPFAAFSLPPSPHLSPRPSFSLPPTSLSLDTTSIPFGGRSTLFFVLQLHPCHASRPFDRLRFLTRCALSRFTRASTIPALSNPPSHLLLLPSLFRVTVPWTTKPRERVLLSFLFFSIFPPAFFPPSRPRADE